MIPTKLKEQLTRKCLQLLSTKIMKMHISLSTKSWKNRKRLKRKFIYHRDLFSKRAWQVIHVLIRVMVKVLDFKQKTRKLCKFHTRSIPGKLVWLWFLTQKELNLNKIMTNGEKTRLSLTLILNIKIKSITWKEWLSLKLTSKWRICEKPPVWPTYSLNPVLSRITRTIMKYLHLRTHNLLYLKTLKF